MESFVRYRFKYVLPKIQEITLGNRGLQFFLMFRSFRQKFAIARELKCAYEAHEKQMCLHFTTRKIQFWKWEERLGLSGCSAKKS